MKRFALIVTGVLGSLGAILSITPPQFGNGSALGTGTLTGGQSASAATPSATPVPTATATKQAVKKVTAKAKAKATAKATKKATPKATQAASTPAATASSTPSAAASTPASSGVSGTFVGATYEAREPNGQLWGNVTVTVVLKDGKIVSSTGSQSPSSRGPYAFSALDPFFKTNQMTIAQIKAETANKVVADSLYVSRVTYSSLAYWSSIKSALSKAGY